MEKGVRLELSEKGVRLEFMAYAKFEPDPFFYCGLMPAVLMIFA